MIFKIGKHIFSNEEFHNSWSYQKEGSPSLYRIRSWLFAWTVPIQDFLYDRKIYWHNWFTDECTKGFECCRHKMNEEEQEFINKIVYASEEEMPVIYIKNQKGE